MPFIAEIQSLNPARPDLEAWEGKGIIEEAPTQNPAHSLSRPSTPGLSQAAVLGFDSWSQV